MPELRRRCKAEATVLGRLCALQNAGSAMSFFRGELGAKVRERRENGEVILGFPEKGAALIDIPKRIGRMPLPPYISATRKKRLMTQRLTRPCSLPVTVPLLRRPPGHFSTAVGPDRSPQTRRAHLACWCGNLMPVKPKIRTITKCI